MTSGESIAMVETVLGERAGSAGLVRLNRPKALNSLNLTMIRRMRALLETYAADGGVSSVIVSGEGERAFCAGGDIRAMYESGRADGREATDFWREEFRLNHFIAHYPKPYAAIMDGIVMGGGAGISVHGSHRIVTERTRLAMPETGIGYFPDIGASWFLPRLAGRIGFWMGLTGHEIGAADAVHAGLADYCVPSATLLLITEALAALPAGASASDVGSVIERFAVTPPSGPLAASRALIDRIFALETVEEIVAALTQDGSDFARETLGHLSKRSPLSMKLSLRLLRLGERSDSLAECLEREFAACTGMLSNPDFYEGVRAAVIDKDRNPKWRPASLSDVTEADLARFFPADHPSVFPEHRL
ncbi:enoyl-CoA hydratase/isomerase family protein [Rhizobiaceae bacterium BDR2-2]|uniref:3-hydroxyisobutyryl-CoA hydrolase n=1 Tax=Ectorhizobium quercum TaxID=2965071 RepID=A0AAE3SWN3_9HYPH|nr:enoyl-CoA hydratase/isomerase family protein [Ectorhizobium quercum]MCX8999590.1 enoyl-CoA hydratase/isomerase family protein [Ectorhizobium quercum]